MLYSKITLLGALATLSSLVAAHPFADADLFKRVVSPDETCGNVSGGANNGYTCVTGACCSQYVCPAFSGYKIRYSTSFVNPTAIN